MVPMCRMESPRIYEEYRDPDDDTFRRVWDTQRRLWDTQRRLLNTHVEVSYSQKRVSYIRVSRSTENGMHALSQVLEQRSHVSKIGRDCSARPFIGIADIVLL
jgi:hypothetical protein